jgi:hypothetical protein
MKKLQMRDQRGMSDVEIWTLLDLSEGHDMTISCSVVR